MKLRLLLPCAVLSGLLLQGCAVLRQPLDLTSPVLERTADGRIEMEASLAKAHARWAVPFARVSSAVRCRDLASTDEALAREEGCNTLPSLRDMGWVRLYETPDVLNAEERASGLQFAAFGRERPGEARGEIIIGFRGTRFTKLSDWRANLRWFTRFLPLPGSDHYQVVRKHDSEMVTRAIAQARLKFAAHREFDIYTSGHSLGGGLAQLLAYSDHRITAAVVFDPSPVTGFHNVVRDEAVNCSARVVRIYERGEGLSYIRTFFRYFYALSSNIEEVSYDFIHTGGNPFANHSMTDFLKGLEGRADIAAGTAVSITGSGLPDKPDCDCFRKRKPAVQPGSRQFSEAAEVCKAEVPVADGSALKAVP